METKLCPCCEQTKKIESFCKSKKRIYSWCKECLYQNQIERWIKRKIEAIKIMGGKCCKCGYCKNYAALEFHHVDPKEKDANWIKIRQRPWKEIINELKKCVLVCANCHRETHHPDAKIDFSQECNFLLQKEILPTGNCLLCGTEVYRTKYCSVKCSSLSKRKAIRPSRELLIDEINNSSYCAVGRKYGVSDNTIRKWIKQYP